MGEVDRARRERERGDGRTWRERALDAEKERDARLEVTARQAMLLRGLVDMHWEATDDQDEVEDLAALRDRLKALGALYPTERDANEAKR